MSGEVEKGMVPFSDSGEAEALSRLAAVKLGRGGSSRGTRTPPLFVEREDLREGSL